MGLDFHGSDAHWSYGGFNEFRNRLGRKIGIVLDEMRGFEDDTLVRGTPWSTVDDDIVPLLDHSDCDGQLSADDCRKVSKRLRELIADWDDQDYDKVHGLMLADGMERCAREGDALVFC